MKSRLNTPETGKSQSHYTAQDYIDLVERTKNKDLKDYMRAEEQALKRIEDSSHKTFIDLGAGHGRVLPVIAKISRNVISIEINPDMFAELDARSKGYPHAVAVLGDVNNLKEILRSQDVEKPVFLVLQNTLAIIKDQNKFLKSLRSLATQLKGEVIISNFRQEALKDVGIRIYESLESMVGKPDLKKINFKKGIFVTQTGYVSKWWTDKEMPEIKTILGGKVIEEVVTFSYHILHVSFDSNRAQPL